MNAADLAKKYKPGLFKEVDSITSELAEANEFIAKCENSEDETEIIKMFALRNKVKRLKSELEPLNQEMGRLLNECGGKVDKYSAAHRAKVNIEDLKKLNDAVNLQYIKNRFSKKLEFFREINKAYAYEKSIIDSYEMLCEKDKHLDKL